MVKQAIPPRQENPCQKWYKARQGRRAGVLWQTVLPADSDGCVLRKYLILAAGWLLTIIGAVLTPMPIPIPLIGLLPLMAGLAILINHSRPMRRFIQRLRHRVRWFSHMIERFAHRLPDSIRLILARSHPASIERHARINTRVAERIEGE